MKKPTREEIQNMTVNERLFAMELLDQWDKAAITKDRDEMIEILSRCFLTRKQCEETTDAVLKNPSRYGF